MDRKEIVNEIARQLNETGQAVNLEQVRRVVDEALTPYQQALAELEGRKMRFADNAAGRSIEGSKYGRLSDPTTGRDWNADDVEFLHDLLATARAYGISRGPSEELRNLHAAINTRAMDTAESGYGAELVGVQYVGQLWQAAREHSVVFPLIPAFEMNAPSAYLPVEAGMPEMLYVSENTSPTASDYATSKTGSNQVLVAAKKFLIHQVYSGEMEEDSIIPFVPFLRRQAAWALGYYADSAVLNGDTTNATTGNINLDDADPADTKHYLAFDGIRHACLVDNTGNASDHSGAAITFDALLGLRKLMLDRTYLMDWGHPVNPNDLIFVVNPELADEIALLDEFITVDKFGPQATVLTGQVGRIGRHPLVSTIAVPRTEADGKVSNTAGNNTLEQAIAFNRQGFTVGWRRRVKFELERLPGRDQTRIVWSLRFGFGRYSPTGSASGIEAAAVLYNIA